MDEQRSRESPPSVTRGQNSQLEIGLHWLRGSVSHTAFEPLVRYLNKCFGNGTRRQYGWWGYDASIAWDNGMSLHFHSVETRYAITNGLFTLECPGGSLEVMSFLDVVGFLSYLRHKFHLRASRLDVFMDDFARSIVPKRLFATVYAESDAGTVQRCDFTGFRKLQPIAEFGAAGRSSDSVCFGARGKNGSGKYLRVYDKALESDNVNTAVRWELELTGKPADTVFNAVLDADAEAGNELCWIGTPEHPARIEGACVKVLASILAGCIDFRRRTDRAGDKNLCRLQRYAFWEDLLSRLAGAVRVARSVVKKTIARAKAYVENQVTGTLQMIRAAIGEHVFFPWLVDTLDAANRMKPRHERAVRDFLAGLEGLPA